MKFYNNLDSRIAKYLIRKLSSYLYSKEKKKKLTKDNEWSRRFNKSDFFIHPLNGDLKINLYKDSFLSRFIYDGFESDEIDFLNTYLDVGDCFVDIGANVGLFSLYASRKVGLEGVVIAFEPSQETYERLLENVELNKIRNLRAFKLGLSNKSNILSLNISVSGYEAWNTFVEAKDNKFSKKEQVQVKSLDEFLVENSIETESITLIKLDVEGFELNVLKGSQQLLSGENAPVFLIEFTDANANAAGHCCHDIYRLLNNFGYTWYVYEAENKKLIYDPMRINYPYTNLIAIKNLNKNKNLSKFQVQGASGQV